MGRVPEMLRRKGDFAALQRSSKSKMHPLLVARYVPNDLGQTRFGLSTGRRVGGAVVRNRVRRRLRSAIRAHAAELAPGWDVLLVARPPSADADYVALEAALLRVLGAARVLQHPQGHARRDGGATAAPASKRADGVA
jgi:ribonuclease P protein component